MKKTIAILAAFALVAGFAATAVAADWSFYGSARMSTFSNSISEEASATGFDDTDTRWALQTNARIGANVSAGDVGGRFEYGTSGGNANIRLLYGTWNFGGGELLVGQTYTPITFLASGQVEGDDQGLLNFGEVYAGRKPMIQLKFGGFKVALVSPSNTAPTAAGGTFTVAGITFVGIGYNADVDTTLPKLELAYKFSTDMFYVEPYGGYQTFDVVNAADNDVSADAWIVGVNGGVTLGMATIKANFYMANNIGVYGAGTGTLAGQPGPATSGTDFEDNEEMGGLLLANFKFSDMVGFEAGVGYVSQEIDYGSASIEETTMAYYANVPITLADGVYIIPEIGMYDYGDLEATGNPDLDQGDETYIGAKWMINF